MAIEFALLIRRAMVSRESHSGCRVGMLRPSVGGPRIEDSLSAVDRASVCADDERPYHRITVAPHVNPPPNPASTIRSPDRTRPWSRASVSAIAMLAALVLP